MAVTLRDIADRCSVSRAAVSQVLRNPEHSSFPASTRQRILDAAKELNYVPNRLGVLLRKGKTGLMALVCPYHSPEMVDMAQSTARELGYGLLIQFTPDPNIESECKVLRATMGLQVDGIIWQPWGSASQYDQVVEQIQASRTKVVMLETALPGLPEADVVRIDFNQGVRLGVEHLVSQGYQSIVYVTYDTSGGFPNELYKHRTEYYNSLVSEKSLSSVVLTAREFVKKKDYKLDVDRVLELTRQLPGPVGFLCNSDWLAIELSQIAYRHNIDVPNAMGIVSSGDLLLGSEFHLGELIRPALTAIRTPVAEKTGMAVKMLAERVDAKEALASRDKVVNMELIARESTKLVLE